MSNSRAIAAVTATLRGLLTQGLQDDPPGTTVTARPLDKARGANPGNQVNLFLYHTMLSAGWRNMDLPHAVKPGETGGPLLPLNLFYLITAYGEDDEDDLGHLVLGRAMSILHDHPVLSSEDIRQSLTPQELPLHDLYNQTEGIRITFQPMTLEEMSKLWTTFQSQYRISAAYQVAVILVESTRAARTPLPVLRQGDLDRGPTAQADLTPPYPALAAVLPPDPRYPALLGDTLDINGHHLAGDVVEVRFAHPSLADPIIVPPLAVGTDRQVQVTIPSGAAGATNWPAGLYTVSVVVRTTVGGETVERTTNEVPLALAPQISNIAPNPATPDGNGAVRLTVTFAPEWRRDQRVALLFGDREVRPEPLPDDPPPQLGTLDFGVGEVQTGSHVVRLRVGGVDSIPVVRNASPPQFDPNQKVTVQ
jgi:hypothetical protein